MEQVADREASSVPGVRPFAAFSSPAVPLGKVTAAGHRRDGGPGQRAIRGRAVEGRRVVEEGAVRRRDGRGQSGALGTAAPKALHLDHVGRAPCETTVKPVVPAGSWNCSCLAHLVQPERERRADRRGRGGIGARDDGLHAARVSVALIGPPFPATGAVADSSPTLAGAAAGRQTDLPGGPAGSTDQTGGAAVPGGAGGQAELTGGELDALASRSGRPPAALQQDVVQTPAREVGVVDAGQPAGAARSAAGRAEVGRGPGARSPERGEQQAERQGEPARAGAERSSARNLRSGHRGGRDVPRTPPTAGRGSTTHVRRFPTRPAGPPRRSIPSTGPRHPARRPRRGRPPGSGRPPRGGASRRSARANARRGATAAGGRRPARG